MENIAVYSDSNNKNTNAISGQTDFSVKLTSAYNKHYASKDKLY
jgi:hypothetical protein